MTYDIFDERNYEQSNVAELKIGNDTFFLARRVSKGEVNGAKEGDVLVDVYNDKEDLLFRAVEFQHKRRFERALIFSKDIDEFARATGEFETREEFEVTKVAHSNEWSFHWSRGTGKFINEEIVKRFEANGLLPPNFAPEKKELPQEHCELENLPQRQVSALKRLSDQEAQITLF